ncbi:hypothetical protein [Spirosoma oryzicola]|uniref:hypothetical protein n=1 Tax=Spirosoma oryzicola TaxID=2898794 RepID=UPI001E2C4274|nr:hypothetical protein [Spirosoma oryzicola]UHG89390.1 hypothetical protein LQ777_14160 [Spirosoma oryzicola]
MKTDRFADSIRRKLDSIRPEFSERDWKRMQASLNQASPSPGAPTPSAHPFAGYTAKLAAAGLVGTAIFLSTTIWQHYELKHLHQTLQQVNQKVNTPTNNAPDQDQPSLASGSAGAQSEQLALQNQRPAGTTLPGEATVKRDTVYIDRYITVPASPIRLRSTDNAQLANQQRRQSSNEPIALTNASDLTTQSGSLSQNDKPRQGSTHFDEATTGAIQPTGAGMYREKREKLLSNATSPAKRQERISESPEKTSPPDAASQQVALTESSGATTRSNGSVANTGNAPVADNGNVPTQSATFNAPPATGSADAAQSAIAFEPMSALPMQLNTIHWDAVLAQRARRMRPARTTVISGQASSAPVVQRVRPIPFQFRAGLGTDLNTQAQSIGAYAEVIAFKHWSLGIGLSQAKFGTSFFPSILDFDKSNPQDFRKQYGRGFDPRFEIFGIQLYTKRIQLPINLSYRIPVSQSLTILPTIGTDLTLQNQQFISFYHQLPFKMGYEKIDGKSIRPMDLLNNATFGASVEWQAKHWAAQAGPLITTPLQPDPGCQQATTIGLRARVFYQF